MLRAWVMVGFPGGFGTRDELFDALTPIQTGRAKPMPILLFERYWRRIVNFDAIVQEGVISLNDRDLVRCVASAEAAWLAICARYGIGPARADERS
jgi:predicted Rossmann-fold nucleotide-binding protein